MVNDKLFLWGMFGLICAATVLLRSNFIVAGERMQLSPWFQSALRYAPAAALAAIVAPDILMVSGALHPFNPKLLSAVVVIVSVSLSRNSWLPFISGMGVLLLARFI